MRSIAAILYSNEIIQDNDAGAQHFPVAHSSMPYQKPSREQWRRWMSMRARTKAERAKSKLG